MPRGQERVQIFGPGALRTGGFFIAGRAMPHVDHRQLCMLNGISSLQFTGGSIFISEPERGSLFTEYSAAGDAAAQHRPTADTGYEQDRDLHLALNAGLPLVDPTGGFYLRVPHRAGRCSASTTRAAVLLFERHIEGRGDRRSCSTAQPTTWPTRRVEDREVPFVQPIVRTAAVDPQGQLWVSLIVPYTYVYDTHGDKTRTVQFSAAGIISPTSLFFTSSGHLLVTPGCYEFDPNRR